MRGALLPTFARVEVPVHSRAVREHWTQTIYLICTLAFLPFVVYYRSTDYIAMFSLSFFVYYITYGRDGQSYQYCGRSYICNTCIQPRDVAEPLQR